MVDDTISIGRSPFFFSFYKSLSPMMVAFWESQMKTVDKINLIIMMKDKDRFDHAFSGSSRISESLYRGRFLFPT